MSRQLTATNPAYVSTWKCFLWPRHVFEIILFSEEVIPSQSFWSLKIPSLVENDTILFRSCLSLGQDRTQPEFLLLLLYDSYQVVLGTLLKYEWWLADTFKIWQRCQYRRKLYTYTHNFEKSRRDLHSNHLGFNTNFLSVNWENILEKRCWFFASRKE